MLCIGSWNVRVVKYLHNPDANTAVVYVSCMTMHKVKCLSLYVRVSKNHNSTEVSCVRRSQKLTKTVGLFSYSLSVGDVIRPGDERAARTPAVKRAALTPIPNKSRFSSLQVKALSGEEIHLNLIIKDNWKFKLCIFFIFLCHVSNQGYIFLN